MGTVSSHLAREELGRPRPTIALAIAHVLRITHNHRMEEPGNARMGALPLNVGHRALDTIPFESDAISLLYLTNSTALLAGVFSIYVLCWHLRISFGDDT